MEGHNRTYPSLRWVGMDDEQIVWKSGSFDVQSRSRSDSAVRHKKAREKARESSMPDRLLLLVFSCLSLRVGQIFWPGPNNWWRWRSWSVHRMSLGVWQENCFEQPCKTIYLVTTAWATRLDLAVVACVWALRTA